jgi:hypothetical protein
MTYKTGAYTWYLFWEPFWKSVIRDWLGMLDFWTAAIEILMENICLDGVGAYFTDNILVRSQNYKNLHVMHVYSYTIFTGISIVPLEVCNRFRPNNFRTLAGSRPDSIKHIWGANQLEPTSQTNVPPHLAIFYLIFDLVGSRTRNQFLLTDCDELVVSRRL